MSDPRRVEDVHAEHPLAGPARSAGPVVELDEVQLDVVGAVHDRDRVAELAPALVLVERGVGRAADRVVRAERVPAGEGLVGQERRSAGRRVGRATALIRTGAGVAGAEVVNVHLYPLVMGVPSVALIVLSSPAVYVVELASAAVGVSVAVAVGASYETVAGTVVPPGVFNVKLEVVTVEESSARENVAFTVAAATSSAFTSRCVTARTDLLRTDGQHHS